MAEDNIREMERVRERKTALGRWNKVGERKTEFRHGTMFKG